MKKVFVFLLATIYASVVYSQDNRKTVAVIPAEGVSVSVEIKNGITNGLEEGVYKSGGYRLLARGEAFTKALSEMTFQQSGAVADNQLIQFGNALGANYVCYASVDKYSDELFRISYRMIDVASGEIVNVGSETIRDGASGLLTATDNIAKKLFGGRSSSGTTESTSAATQEMDVPSSTVPVRQIPSEDEISFYFAGYNNLVSEEHGKLPIKVQLRSGYNKAKEIGYGTLGGGFSIKIKDPKMRKPELEIFTIRGIPNVVIYSGMQINMELKNDYEFTVIKSDNKGVTYYNFVLK